jgi:hypothetical protein
LHNQKIMLIFVSHQLKLYIMRTLFVSTETFTEMLMDLIITGITFESEEKNGGILITFTGGY